MFLPRLPVTLFYQHFEGYVTDNNDKWDNSATCIICLHLHSAGVFYTHELPYFKQENILQLMAKPLNNTVLI
jgi:hypothetical protein